MSIVPRLTPDDSDEIRLSIPQFLFNLLALKYRVICCIVYSMKWRIDWRRVWYDS